MPKASNQRINELHERLATVERWKKEDAVKLRDAIAGRNGRHAEQVPFLKRIIEHNEFLLRELRTTIKYRQ